MEFEAGRERDPYIHIYICIYIHIYWLARMFANLLQAMGGSRDCKFATGVRMYYHGSWLRHVEVTADET